MNKKGITIFGPVSGTLNLTIEKPGDHAIRSSYIYSNKTQNMFINIGPSTGNYVAQNLHIYGSDIQDRLEITFSSDAKLSQIYCPLSRGSDCIVNCQNNIGSDMCQSMSVHAKYGLNNNLQLC